MASGIVIALLGLWILLRTISSGNQGGGNLVDWLMSLGGSSSTSSSSTSSTSKQQPGAGAPAGPLKNIAGQPAPPGTGPRPQGPHVLGGPR